MKKIFNTDLNSNNIGENVHLHGWVQKKRNLGGIVFIDLRDRSGIIQLIVRPDNKFYNLAESLKSEYVIEVFGTVVERESKNKNLKTGDIEIDVANDFREGEDILTPDEIVQLSDIISFKLPE